VFLSTFSYREIGISGCSHPNELIFPAEQRIPAIYFSREFAAGKVVQQIAPIRARVSLDVSQFESYHPGKLNSTAVMLRVWLL
jgi:hypothetical protein